MKVALQPALHLGGAIYFAFIIVSGGLYHAGGIAPRLLRTKAFCLASSALVQVEVEGHCVCPSAVSWPGCGTGLLLCSTVWSAVHLLSQVKIILIFKQANHISCISVNPRASKLIHITVLYYSKV